MTRIFEALKKAQRAGAMPFPPVEAAPQRPAMVTRATAAASGASSAPGAAVATLEPALMPRIETMLTPALPPEVMSQMTALRIGLESALEERKTRVVMFLGAMGGEGVTTIATQFAAALAAESRGPSLLLDTRAQRPGGALRPFAASRGTPATRGRADDATRGPVPVGVARLGDDLVRAGSRARRRCARRWRRWPTSSNGSWSTDRRCSPHPSQSTSPRWSTAWCW